VFQKFTTADKEQQLQEALTLGDPLNDLPLVLEADYFRVAPGRYFVPISVKIQGSQVTLVKKGTAQTADFDFIGMVRDTSGKSISNMPNWATLGVRDEITISLKESEAAQIEKHNLQYDTGLTLPPGKYTVRFLARENTTGKMGTFETSLTVPDLNNDKALRVSSVIYASERKPAAEAVGSASNDKRALANSPLIQDGQKVTPSILRAFRKDQTMYVYFEVYDPSPDEAKAPDVTADVELLRGPRKIYTSAPTEVKKLDSGRPGVARFLFQIPLSKVPAGQYTTQVNIFDTTGKKFATPRNAVYVLPEETASVAPAAAAPAAPNQ
jgi:hypothetical protein